MKESCGTMKMQILIQRSTSPFKWENAFSNRMVNKEILSFNDGYDGQKVPWRNNNLKIAIQEKSLSTLFKKLK